jgi:predicted nucleotidyltransferase
MTANFDQILPLLATHGVRFILIGGGAAIAHGSARATQDVDVVYARDEANIRALAECLQPVAPRLRGAPEGLPFFWDEATIRNGLNFTLTTDVGDLDLLGEVAGSGTYESLLPDSTEIEIFGTRCRCVTLSRLIRLKQAAGRPRDLEAIAELQALAEESEEGRA